ncbi:hypothetical protein [Jannaschia seosinensis]|nr:hypothetical protein [Jannaschia seosinensis]
MIRSLAQEERDARDEEFITDDLPDEVAAITEDIPLILREAGANAAEDAGPSDDAAFQVPWPREWETSASDLAAQNETSFLTASDDDAGNSPFEVEFVEEPAFGSGDLQDTFARARARDRDVLTLTDRDLVSAPDGPAPGSPTDAPPPVSVPEMSDGTDPQADHLRPVEPLLPLPAETTASSVNSSDLGSDFDAEEQSPLVGPGEQDQGVEDDLESSIGSERLRQLIAEVVREELSGELGERITRNLRKLVRREIERALASSDFD